MQGTRVRQSSLVAEYHKSLTAESTSRVVALRVSQRVPQIARCVRQRAQSHVPGRIQTAGSNPSSRRLRTANRWGWQATRDWGEPRHQLLCVAWYLATYMRTWPPIPFPSSVQPEAFSPSTSLHFSGAECSSVSRVSQQAHGLMNWQFP